MKDEIREFVSKSIYKTLEEMTARARECKIDLETVREEEAGSSLGIIGSTKKFDVFDTRSRDQQVQKSCGKCGKTHEGVCSVSGSGCFRCDKTGHYNRDCTITTTT